MIRNSVCALALLIALPGCKDKAREAVPPAPTAKNAPAASDPAPPPAAEPAITERESISVAGQRACALTVVYSGKTAQPVTWNGEDCGQITTAFADEKRLRSLDQWGELSEETRGDIARTGGKVLYIEGQATASIYPLNVAGRIYHVPVAD